MLSFTALTAKPPTSGAAIKVRSSKMGSSPPRAPAPEEVSVRLRLLHGVSIGDAGISAQAFS